MLLWLGIVLIALGFACLAIDRAAAHALYDQVHAPMWERLDRITHWAKASHWLIAAAIAYAAAEIVRRVWGDSDDLHLAQQCALAFIASLMAGSAILHGIKLVFGRRRPRDDMEMGLYGFVPLSFDLQYNSFPSGHALTIMCVAVIASMVWPQGALVWFAIALGLGLVRALLTAHFLSDVFVGAGIGMLAAREIVLNFFAPLAPNWF